jgi:hypothetical protein
MHSSSSVTLEFVLSTVIPVIPELNHLGCVAAATHPFLLCILFTYGQIFGCVLCAVGSYALNNKVAVLAGQTLPQGELTAQCLSIWEADLVTTDLTLSFSLHLAVLL